MKTMQIQRNPARAAVALAVAAIGFGGARPAAAAPEATGKINLAQALKRTVLVFPFDVPMTVPDRDEVRGLLTDTALSRLLASNSYSITQYNRNLPTVARLHLDQALSDADVTEPFAEDNVKATKITKAVGYDVAFVGSVDEYQFNEADKSVAMTVSGRLLDVMTGKFVSTPVTLSVTSSKGGNAKETDRALEAARNAGSQLMVKLVPNISQGVITTPNKTPQAVPMNQGTGTPRKKRDNGWLWGLLAVGLGLGIGLASSGGRGGGGGANGSDTPPPPP
jgi:hypothetical protein